MNMKKKAMRVPVLVIMMLLVLLSCNKDNKPDDNAEADVYIKSVLIDGVPVFGIAHYVLGYATMNAVTVDLPGGMTDQLNAYDAGKKIFYIEPSIAEGTYSNNVPEPGIYYYNVTFSDGVESVFINQLTSSYLLPAEITSVVKSSDSQSVILSWAPVAGVEYFQLSIYKEGALKFSSPPFTPPTGNSIDIPISIITSPYMPGSYTIQLDAIDYESLETGKLHAISSASSSIVL